MKLQLFILLISILQISAQNKTLDCEIKTQTCNTENQTLTIQKIDNNIFSRNLLERCEVVNVLEEMVSTNEDDFYSIMSLIIKNGDSLPISKNEIKQKYLPENEVFKTKLIGKYEDYFIVCQDFKYLIDYYLINYKNGKSYLTVGTPFLSKDGNIIYSSNINNSKDDTNLVIQFFNIEQNSSFYYFLPNFKLIDLFLIKKENVYELSISIDKIGYNCNQKMELF